MGMKNRHLSLLLMAGFMVFILPVCSSARTHSNIGISARRHGEHREFKDLPFGNRDHSIGINYEFHEATAFWQFGLAYTPSLTIREGETEAPDYALTPEINLIAKDRMYHGGLGVASTYTEIDGGEWTTVYWQFILGLRFELSQRLSLSGYGYYPFERWGDLDSFRFKDVEFGLRLGARF